MRKYICDMCGSKMAAEKKGGEYLVIVAGFLGFWVVVVVINNEK